MHKPVFPTRMGVDRQDPAAKLSGYLGLGSGVALGAILGGVSSLWLILGGPPRIARLAGWMIALAAGVLVWNIGPGPVWVRFSCPRVLIHFG